MSAVVVEVQAGQGLVGYTILQSPKYLLPLLRESLPGKVHQNSSIVLKGFWRGLIMLGKLLFNHFMCTTVI